MSVYMIEKPCSIFLDGTVVRYRNTGAVLELDDATAAGLGDAVRKCGEASVPVPESPPEPDGQPATLVEPDEAQGRGRRPWSDDG